MLWWHSWSWYFTTYGWLQYNNLWKSTVAFFTTLLLGVTLTAVMRPWRAWKRHRETQEKIADRLDTSTPGGMQDVVKALHRLLNDLDEGEAPDDNGTDIDLRPRKRRAGRGGGQHHVPESGERAEHGGSIIPRGGGSAGHR